TLYGSEPIERGLRDLEWVALRGAAHARVVEFFARRVTTLPMKLFTLFTSDARAVAHVTDDTARVRRVLARVAGHEEWGVRLLLDAALLVPGARLARFKQRARKTAAALAARGYRMSVTGPWPAYNFVGDGR